MNEIVTMNSISDNEQRNAIHKMLGEFLITVPNKYFAGQTLDIDGYRFINCYLSNCNINIRRGTFELFNCKMEQCTLYFAEEAQKTVQMLMTCEAMRNVVINPSLKPITNSDGTLSVGKGASC